MNTNAQTNRLVLVTGSKLGRRIICVYAGWLALHVWIRSDHCFAAAVLHELHAAIAPVAATSGSEG